MSMNASARLWYGVWKPTVDERIQREVEEPADGGYEKVVDGVMIEFLYVGDHRIGLGGTAAHAWWAENDKPVDALTEIERVKAAVDKFFDEFGVPGDRGVYLTADYS